MIKSIDSFYLAVKARIQQKNVSRQVLGVMHAQDWPPEDVVLEAFYLLNLGDAPLGKQAYSAAIPVVVHTVQWVWAIVGTDIQKGIQIRSRGDRYRTHFKMKGEILWGLYPYFAPKNTVTVDGNGVLQVTPVAPAESFVWSPASFLDKNDKASGVLYGSASVRITDMTEEVTDMVQI